VASARTTHLEVQGVRVPRLLYGTAWKEEETVRLTGLALAAGFRGIDTANQRRHYHEAAVGEAVKEAFKGGLARDDLFLQTKFTHRGGQDHRLPYDPEAPIAKQVEQSFASSLEHFGVDRLDAYLLHGPSTRVGLAAQDWDAWHAIEDLQRSGRTRLIGVSNVTAEQLELLRGKASVKPMVVQNRCFTRPESDRAVRSVCQRHGLVYEGFSLLTGHRALMEHPRVHAMAARTGATVPQVVFRYCLDKGMVVLTGTTSPDHMAQDLAADAVKLMAQDIAAIDLIVE
jgi:diketogulonate reductase-like aldo/keto reductase